MRDKFLIGELSKLFHISSDTLRHYDRIGLLKPVYDENNDYRYYSIRDFFKLSRILFFKKLGISLKEIKGYMGNKNASNLVNMLRSKDEEIGERIRELNHLQRKVRMKLDLLERSSEDMDQVKVKQIKKRMGIFLDLNDVESDYGKKQAFKKSEKYMKFSSWLAEGQVYTSLSKAHLSNQIYTRFRYFIEIVDVDPIDLLQLETVPEGDYACIVFLGPYRDMEKHYRILIRWIEENGYVIAGDSIEKNIIDYDFSNSENEYVSEIQIPIAPR